MVGASIPRSLCRRVRLSKTSIQSKICVDSSVRVRLVRVSRAQPAAIPEGLDAGVVEGVTDRAQGVCDLGRPHALAEGEGGELRAVVAVGEPTRRRSALIDSHAERGLDHGCRRPAVQGPPDDTAGPGVEDDTAL